MKELPVVTVVIPCRNERLFIGPCLDSIQSNDYPQDKLEIIVADGMSDDGTRDILLDYTTRYQSIRVVDNPGRIVSTGLNRAIKLARGEIILRMDAHTEYAAAYIRQCVTVLLETGADNVGGAWRTQASGILQKAIALAFHSPFSTGGARSHKVDYEGDIDTVIYGCWWRAKLLELGMFDEELVRNQDDELNLRITRSGGKLWQSARIKSCYRPRPSLKGLWRQYTQYGYWKVRVIQKHKQAASWRHLVPGVWLGGSLLLALLAPFNQLAAGLLVATILLYVVANLLFSMLTCWRREHWRQILVVPAVFAVYHLSYGYGFLRGLLDFVLLHRAPRTEFKTLTREHVP